MIAARPIRAVELTGELEGGGGFKREGRGFASCPIRAEEGGAELLGGAGLKGKAGDHVISFRPINVEEATLGGRGGGGAWKGAVLKWEGRGLM